MSGAISMQGKKRSIDSKNLQKCFQKLGPWTTKFKIDGVTYGGNFDPFDDSRIDHFFQSFPDVKTILELGSFEGGHTFALSKRQGINRVVGIESRKSNVKKARFVQKLLNISNVEFIIANLENYNLSQIGPFDAVFCSGVLYHLPRPWDLIEQISCVTDKLFIWTHYSFESKADKILAGYKGMAYKEHGIGDPLSGMSAESFWLTLNSLEIMLLKYGFTKFRIIADNPNHQNGPCVMVSAIASDPNRV